MVKRRLLKSIANTLIGNSIDNVGHGTITGIQKNIDSNDIELKLWVEMKLEKFSNYDFIDKHSEIH